MDEASPSPPAVPSGPTRLLTIGEAAAATGLTRKALQRRIDRETLRAVKDDSGRWAIPRAELVRAELLDKDGRPVSPGGEIVVLWRQLFEREREEREKADATVRDLERDLIAIANAGPIRALRLRRQLRERS